MDLFAGPFKTMVPGSLQKAILTVFISAQIFGTFGIEKGGNDHERQKNQAD